MRNAISLMAVLLLAAPIVSRADKKDDALAEIQRDVAQVGEQVNNLQKTQAAQAKEIEALQGMLQQAAAASAQTSQQMEALKKDLTALINSSLGDQQAKLTQSINATVGSQMGSLSTSVDQLNTTFVQMSDRIGKVEAKIGELKDIVSNLNTPPPPPPTAAVVPDAGGPTTSANSACGTPLTLQQAAELDYTTNRDDMALKELAEYIKCFPKEAFAPKAGYLIGMIYLDRAHDYESAVEAFDSVINNYPNINQSQDAMYQKGRALVRWGHKPEARKTLQEFVDTYTVNDNIPQAKELLRTLNASPQSTKKGSPRGGGK